MPQRSTQHATFDMERVYDASPAQVFGAWAGAAAKAKWFGPSEPGNELALDFQVGGARARRDAEGAASASLELPAWPT